ATVTIVNRSVARAEYLASRLSGPIAVRCGGPEVADAIARADLLVNTTPLGMGHLAALSPLPCGSRLSSHTAVFDLVYGRTTPLLAQAATARCATADGLEMLVQQGALSFQLWTGIVPDVTVMREACERALEVPTCCAS
ncbi:MAG: shikimate dehydrogenase, partial [Chloroflexota bacterium]|nr:shikimate dehydrogenase [Chloroflexota bacterium]